MKQTADNNQDELYKGTALEENADIYSRREDKTVKQTWKELDRKGKWQFFKDYIMWKIVVALAVVFFIAVLIHGSFGSGKTTSLYVAIVDEQLEENKVDELTSLLEQLICTSKHEKVMIDDYFYTSSDGLNRIQVYSSAGDIDVIIADETQFSILAGGGYFEDLSEYYGDNMSDEVRSRLYYARGYLKDGTVEMEDNRNGRGPEAAYGISLEGCERYDEIKNLSKKPVIGIVASSDQKENAEKFIDYLMESEK